MTLRKKLGVFKEKVERPFGLEEEGKLGNLEKAELSAVEAKGLKECVK